LPLVLPPALLDMLHVAPGTPEFSHWRGLMFFIPALVGGVFGLLGGYLTDRLGRRRVLTWSILLYAFSAFAAGLSTSLPMLLFFRTTTFIGVCVEFIAAITWLAEVFEDRKQRERWVGITQAFASLGGVFVTLVSIWISSNIKGLPHMGLPLALGSTDPNRFLPTMSVDFLTRIGELVGQALAVHES